MIDDRWVLKISDYGLTRIRQQEKEIQAGRVQIEIARGLNSSEQKKIPELLWTAPEILRVETWNKGTVEGDIYSFAIIVAEILIRKKAYAGEEMSPEGTHGSQSRNRKLAKKR